MVDVEHTSVRANVSSKYMSVHTDAQHMLHRLLQSSTSPSVINASFDRINGILVAALEDEG